MGAFRAHHRRSQPIYGVSEVLLRDPSTWKILIRDRAPLRSVTMRFGTPNIDARAAAASAVAPAPDLGTA
jgi:hypothetical protein